MTLDFFLRQREDLDRASDKIQYFNIYREIPWKNILISTCDAMQKCNLRHLEPKTEIFMLMRDFKNYRQMLKIDLKSFCAFWAQEL